MYTAVPQFNTFQPVYFYNKQIVDKYQSDWQGKTVYQTVPYVRIQTDPQTIIDRPAHAKDYQTHFKEYREYLNKHIEAVQGTPIEYLFGTDPAFVDHLKRNNIHTVEQAAELDQEALNNLGDACRNVKSVALGYIDHTKKEEAHNKLQANYQNVCMENLTLRGKIEKLENVVLALLEQRKASSNRAELDRAIILGELLRSDRIVELERMVKGEPAPLLQVPPPLTADELSGKKKIKK